MGDRLSFAHCGDEIPVLIQPESHTAGISVHGISIIAPCFRVYPNFSLLCHTALRIDFFKSFFFRHLVFLRENQRCFDCIYYYTTKIAALYSVLRGTRLLFVIFHTKQAGVSGLRRFDSARFFCRFCAAGENCVGIFTSSREKIDRACVNVCKSYETDRIILKSITACGKLTYKFVDFMFFANSDRSAVSGR